MPNYLRGAASATGAPVPAFRGHPPARLRPPTLAPWARQWAGTTPDHGGWLSRRAPALPPGPAQLIASSAAGRL